MALPSIRVTGVITQFYCLREFSYLFLVMRAMCAARPGAARIAMNARVSQLGLIPFEFLESICFSFETVHTYLSVPPKFSIAHTIGSLKDQSAAIVHRRLLHERRMTGLSFWTTGYCVSTVGLD